MRRRTVSILLLISISISLYAVNTWYSPYSASFSVDLKNHKSSTGYELNGTQNGIYYSDSSTDGDYHRDWNMVGTVGITEGGDAELTGDHTISFDFSNVNDWTFVSQSDHTLKIPFGVDIVIRYRIRHYQTDGWITAGPDSKDIYRDYTYSVYGNYQEFGYDKNGNLRRSNTSTYDFIVENSKIDRHEEDREDIYGIAGNLQHGYSHDLVGIWIDIVLIIPENRTDFPVGNASDYMASFNVTVDGVTYPVMMSGYYETEPTSANGAVIFNVNTDPSSYKLEVNSLLGNSQGVTIGDYFYTAQAKETNAEGSIVHSESDAWKERPNYRIFASASQSPTAENTDGFVMMHEIALKNNAPLNNRNGFKYGIKLESTAQNSHSGRARSAYFDGTDTNQSGKYLETELRYDQMIGNDGASYTYYDEGDIVLTCYDDSGSPLNNLNGLDLVGGTYSTTVYIHFISEL